MKIVPINFMHKNINRPVQLDRSDYKCCYPFTTQDTISFTRKPKEIKNSEISGFKIKKSRQTRDLRKIPHITCACCGIETINLSDISKLLEDNLFYTGNEALNILKQAGYFKSRNMKVHEKKAFMFSSMCAKLYPTETLRRIYEKSFVQEKILNFDKQTIKEIYKIKDMTENIYHDSQYMVELLNPYKDRMHPTEKDVFELLEKESEKNPQKTFTEILNSPRIKEKKLKELERKQNQIFDDILKIANSLSSSSSKKISNAVENSRIIFNQVVPEIHNKRTLVLDIFKHIAPTIHEIEQMQRILYKVYTLPSSRNDSSAFIIKYADKNPNAIAKIFLNSSAATIEHVKPKHRKNDNGEDKKTNYIVLCAKCNSERQQMPYSEFMKFHPDMPANLQKYLDIVIENINNGTLVDYDDYPIAIMKAIDTEAETKNLLQSRNLNIPEARKNRIKKAK